MTDRNIYQRLNAVREDVGYVRKDANVQGYKAVTHDQVTAAARPSLMKHGVMMVPRQISSETVEAGQTGRGASIIRYAGWYEFAFVNIDKPDDQVTVTIEAHANDHGDKAPGKAISYATKYALLKVLNIETGEDEESRVEAAAKAAPMTAEQADQMRSLMEQTETDEDKFIAFLRGRGFEVSALTDLSVGGYQFGMQMLQRKRAEAEKKDKEEAA